MRDFPTDPMRQHDMFIAAICADWLEAGTVTRNTPRANRILEISKQITTNHRDGSASKKPLPIYK